MDVPGTKEEYKNELISILPPKYDRSNFNTKKFPNIFYRKHNKLLGSRYEFVGVIDNRSITPESLQEALPELQSGVKEQLTTWQYNSFLPYLNVVGVTDEITTATREYLSEGPPEFHIECPFTLSVVDVKSGTSLRYTDSDISMKGDNFREYLVEPLD